MISKKVILSSSGIWAAITLLMGTMEPYQFCGPSWRTCMDVNYQIGLISLSIIPLFIFSLITFWMRDEIYQSWLKFAIWWIPLSMLLIFLAPEYSHDWMYRIEKGTVAFATSAIFVLISTVIILWKWAVARRPQ